MTLKVKNVSLKFFARYKLILVFLLILFLYFLINSPNSKQLPNANYYKNCLKLYKKLRFPNQSLIIRPPPRTPPPELYNDFIQNGEMPISRYFYRNDAYNDSNSEKKEEVKRLIDEDFDEMLDKVRKNKALNYGDKSMNRIIHSYSSEVKNKKFAVIGTIIPWIEAIAYDTGASHITTIDYTRNKYQRENLEWMHVNDYLDYAIENFNFEHFYRRNNAT